MMHVIPHLWAIAFLINLVLLGIILKQLKQLGSQHKIQSDSLTRELHVLTGGLAGMGKHLANLEKQYAALAIKQDELSRQQQVQFEQHDNSNYIHASKLIEKGADVHEVVNSCGLSRAEAELLKRLNAPQKTEPLMDVETVIPIVKADTTETKSPRIVRNPRKTAVPRSKNL